MLSTLCPGQYGQYVMPGTLCLSQWHVEMRFEWQIPPHYVILIAVLNVPQWLDEIIPKCALQ